MIYSLPDKARHTLDPKGRLLLPKELRDSFKIKRSDVLYLLPSLSDPSYLEIRTAKQWEVYRRSLKQGEPGEQKKDSFRYAMVIKDTSTVDGQGRIVVPQRIRDACGLDGSVAIIDMEEYIEVWSEASFHKKYNDLVRAFKERNDKTF